MIALLVFCSIFWVLLIATAVMYFNTSHTAIQSLLVGNREHGAALRQRLSRLSKSLMVFFVLWVLFSGIYFFVQSTLLFSNMH